MNTKLTEKEKIKNAFKDLKKLGYTTRMNFECCMGCAWAVLNEKGVLDKALYWHHQDNESFNSNKELINILNIRYFGIDIQEVVSILRKHGLKVADHDGDVNKTIQIFPDLMEVNK